MDILKNKINWRYFNKLIFILMASLVVIAAFFSTRAMAIEEYATSEIYLQTAEEPGPEPVPVPDPGPVDPGVIVHNVQTGDPLTIMVLVLGVVALVAMLYVCFRYVRSKRINVSSIKRSKHAKFIK